MGKTSSIKESKVNSHNGAVNMTETIFDKYKKQIAIVVVAIIVVVAGLLLYKAFVSGPREEKASTALAKGQEYFNMEQFDKALNGDGAAYAGFLKISSDYSGTDAANLANLYAGICYANLGKWNEAIEKLEKFSPESDAMISPAAVAALGNAYANTGNIDKAISKLQKAADMADSKAENGANMSISPTFRVQAAQLLESQGKKAEALKVYQDIKKKYVNASLVQSSEIDKYIERVSE